MPCPYYFAKTTVTGEKKMELNRGSSKPGNQGKQFTPLLWLTFTLHAKQNIGVKKDEKTPHCSSQK